MGSACATTAAISILGEFDEGAVGEGEIDVVFVLGNGAEYGITCITFVAFISFIPLVAFCAIGTIGAILSIFTVSTVLAVCAGGFAELCPVDAVVGDVPIVVLYFQLGGVAVDAVGSVVSVPAIFSVLTFVARVSLIAFVTFLAGNANLVAIGVSEPVAVHRPIIDTVGVLLGTHRGFVAVCTILAVLTVGAVVDCNRVAVLESDSIADHGATIANLGNVGDIVAVVLCLDKGFEGGDVGVHLLTECLQSADTAVHVAHYVPYRIFVVATCQYQHKHQQDIL